MARLMRRQRDDSVQLEKVQKVVYRSIFSTLYECHERDNVPVCVKTAGVNARRCRLCAISRSTHM